MTSTENCSVCSKAGEKEKQLLKCGRCHVKLYCGSACQKSDWSEHKKSCTPQNFILRFEIWQHFVSDPIVTRTLSCPARAKFSDLHKALQIAFAWSSTHTYDFKIKDPVLEAFLDAQDAAKGEAAQMAELMENMMSRTSLFGQPAPAGRKYHLRVVQQEGEDGGQFYPDVMHSWQRENPETPEKFASNVRLYEVFDNKTYMSKNPIFEYEYDFGDSWIHEFTIVGRAPATKIFKCIEGSGHHVAEDCGGGAGYIALKAAYRTTRPNREQREKRHWYETHCTNGDPRGLGSGRERVFLDAGVNAKLAALQGTW